LAAAEILCTSLDQQLGALGVIFVNIVLIVVNSDIVVYKHCLKVVDELSSQLYSSVAGGGCARRRRRRLWLQLSIASHDAVVNCCRQLPQTRVVVQDGGGDEQFTRLLRCVKQRAAGLVQTPEAGFQQAKGSLNNAPSLGVCRVVRFLGVGGWIGQRRHQPRLQRITGVTCTYIT